MTVLEKVHTITDWYDGARGGVADLNGVPHYYENRWSDSKQDWNEVYLLTPLDADTFSLALEDWEIWLRWEKAFKEGETTQETHPALPEDSERHSELDRVLTERLTVSERSSIKARAEFVYGQPTLVRWSVEDS